MTLNPNQIPTPSSKTEAKVKAATWATFLVTLIGTAALTSTVTDMVPALPDWLEAPGYSLVSALATFLAGYTTRSKPDSLSDSTVDALKKWLRDRMPKYGSATE